MEEDRNVNFQFRYELANIISRRQLTSASKRIAFSLFITLLSLAVTGETFFQERINLIIEIAIFIFFFFYVFDGHYARKEQEFYDKYNIEDPRLDAFALSSSELISFLIAYGINLGFIEFGWASNKNLILRLGFFWFVLYVIVVIIKAKNVFGRLSNLVSFIQVKLNR